MSKVSFDREIVEELCKRHDVYTPGFSRNGQELEFSALPILPFLIELAQAHGLSPDMLEVTHNHGGPGCDTCGYGSECEFIVSEK